MSIIKYQRPTFSLWPGLGRLSNLHDEIDRLFESPLAAFGASPYAEAWLPAVDVVENKDNFVVKAELPGMKKDEIQVTLQDGLLTLSGERKFETKSEDAEVHRAERFVGRFQRTLSLPSTVAADQVKAAYADGVLTITLPKSEEAKARKIDVAMN
ncbi:MAG: Hsp20/alpha crystallin family protein [Verrucomicrobia bacterium]|nr:MAG: Hsp20/alpha crystallin family protein [Verrucomicrobiota bacterium]